MPQPAPSAREGLLRRCLEFVHESGFSDLSLREIAAGVGTSHRMLIYHFGSREGLLAAVVSEVEAVQRQGLAELAAGTGDPGELSRLFWRRISDPALAPAERLFFEIYVHALRDRSWTSTFREQVIAAWQQPLAEIFQRQGVAPAEAASGARLFLAVGRGLLLDLLLTGDDASADAAAEHFISLVVSTLPSGRDAAR